MADAYSVVVPVYNAARTLECTLASIDALDPKPTAIYVVDDASTDDSIAIAGRFARVTVIPLARNGGPGRARNAGVQRAEADLLLMLDSDCYIDAVGFRGAYDRIVAQAGLAGIMGVPVRDISSGPFAGAFKNYWYNLEFEAWGSPPRTLYGSCFLMRRQAYLAVGGFDESFGRTPCEDAEFYFRLVHAGFQFERDMQFTFIHDKRMSIRQLMRASFERSVSIVRNLHGKQGQVGKPWTLAEQVKWALEIGSGTVSATGVLVLFLTALSNLFPSLTDPGMSLLHAEVLFWLLSLFVFFFCIRDKLAFAYHEVGFAFASKAFLCRMIEMPAVTTGIAWGVLSWHAALQTSWRASVTAPNSDKSAG